MNTLIMEKTPDDSYQQPSVVYSWQDGMLYIGKLPCDSRFYANAVCLIGVSLHSTITVYKKDKQVQCNSFFMPPGVEHRVTYDQHDIIVWFLIEPTHMDYSCLFSKISQKVDDFFINIDDYQSIKATFLDLYQNRPCKQEACDKISAALHLDQYVHYAGNVKDMRILKTMERINLDLTCNIPSRALAEEVGLSNGRLQQLFKQQVHMSISQYRLWRRLKYACELSSNLKSFTEIACASGFSDSAHFSRAFHNHFGKTASSLLGASNNVSFIF